MARIGISITKSCSFRNSTQEFTNVYYYQGGTLPDIAGADALIDELTTIEKTLHSSAVTFVRGRCWSQVGSPASNNMISQKNLSGTGARATLASLDKERAFLFRIRAGNDSRGQPVYLRKWFHACGVLFSGQGVSAGILENTTGFSAGDKTSMETAVAPLRTLSSAGGGWVICSKAGRDHGFNEVFKSHNFLEHHQLGDMWRAQ